MSILVTGSEGFIGRHLVAELRSQGEQVITCDRQPGAELQLDLGDEDQCQQLPPAAEISRVIHLAALAKVRLCEARPHEALLCNLFSTDNLCQRYGNRVHLASTWLDDLQLAYVRTKRAAEQLVHLASGSFTRLGNVYGRGGHGVIDRWIGDYLARRPLTVFRPYTRCSFIHVTDVIHALLLSWPRAEAKQTVSVQQLASWFPPDAVFEGAEITRVPLEGPMADEHASVFAYIQQQIACRRKQVR